MIPTHSQITEVGEITSRSANETVPYNLVCSYIQVSLNLGAIQSSTGTILGAINKLFKLCIKCPMLANVEAREYYFCLFT